MPDTTATTATTAPVYAAPVFLDTAPAPLPTPQTLSRRRNVVRQLGRFVAFNVKMIGMILHGAH
ncbi:MAG: hypothetical protein LBR33_05485 [Propionibacteriaceae bacterium]|jgi:hypothetical protein|nr:hypothetical protein [Propionibacteriaceae bacterium]